MILKMMKKTEINTNINNFKIPILPTYHNINLYVQTQKHLDFVLIKTFQPSKYIYTHDFDTNGIIYWLGTNKGTQWKNFRTTYSSMLECPLRLCLERTVPTPLPA